jgi:hypothetical protein
MSSSDLDRIVVYKRAPVVVVSFAALFGSVTLSGETVVAMDVSDILDYFAANGRYILVDCNIPLEEAAVELRAYAIPFNGLTYDGRKGQMFDPTDYDKRVASHVGWDCVDSIIDEDIMRLDLAQKRGVNCIHVLAGCVISQMSFGKPRVIIKPIAEAFTAAQGSTQ